MLTMSYFGNDKYKVLYCLYKRQIIIGNEKITKLSQEEMCRIVKLSKAKVNNIVNELKNDGYLEQTTLKGKYILTDKATIELNQIRNGDAQK